MGWRQWPQVQTQAEVDSWIRWLPWTNNNWGEFCGITGNMVKSLNSSFQENNKPLYFIRSLNEKLVLRNITFLFAPFEKVILTDFFCFIPFCIAWDSYIYCFSVKFACGTLKNLAQVKVCLNFHLVGTRFRFKCYPLPWLGYLVTLLCHSGLIMR